MNHFSYCQASNGILVRAFTREIKGRELPVRTTPAAQSRFAGINADTIYPDERRAKLASELWLLLHSN